MYSGLIESVVYVTLGRVTCLDLLRGELYNYSYYESRDHEDKNCEVQALN